MVASWGKLIIARRWDMFINNFGSSSTTILSFAFRTEAHLHIREILHSPAIIVLVSTNQQRPWRVRLHSSPSQGLQCELRSRRWISINGLRCTRSHPRISAKLSALLVPTAVRLSLKPCSSMQLLIVACGMHERWSTSSATGRSSER